MLSVPRLGLTWEPEHPEALDGWIAWGRIAAVPFAFLEVGIERGNYPPGDERLAWALAAVFAAGALLFIRFPRLRAAGLAFDWAVVSAWVILYSFEAGTPVRQLLLLPVVEAALRYGLRGGLLMPVLSLPALVFFEWRQAVRLDLHPFDAGHIVGPVGIGLLAGVIVGALVERLRLGSPPGSAGKR